MGVLVRFMKPGSSFHLRQPGKPWQQWTVVAWENPGSSARCVALSGPKQGPLLRCGHSVALSLAPGAIAVPDVLKRKLRLFFDPEANWEVAFHHNGMEPEKESENA